MAAFKEIIDVIMGLDVYLPWAIYVYDEEGNQILLAPGGYTRINGETASKLCGPVNNTHNRIWND